MEKTHFKYYVALGDGAVVCQVSYAMHSPRADLADPSAIAALGHLEMVARWVVDGFLAGVHRSTRKGQSVEFAEHRPYQQGDDLRYMDWHIAARTDRYMVKQFEEETNTKALLVTDSSASMNWRSLDTLMTKQSYAAHILAALGLLLLKQRDAVGVVRTGDQNNEIVVPSSRSGQWYRVAGSLSRTGGGEADLAAAVNKAAAFVDGRGFVIIASDLLMDHEALVEAVRIHAAARHEVLVIHVLDPAEIDFPFADESRFTDPESTHSIVADPSDVRSAYQNAMKASIGKWRSEFLRVGARYIQARTDQPFGDVLRQISSGGSKGRKATK